MQISYYPSIAMFYKTKQKKNARLEVWNDYRGSTPIRKHCKMICLDFQEQFSNLKREINLYSIWSVPLGTKSLFFLSIEQLHRNEPMN